MDEAWNEHSFTAYSWSLWSCTTYHHRLDYDYDRSVDLTVERTAPSVSLSTTSANWDCISVTYNPGSGEVTNTVFKTDGNDVVGVLSRINNRNVTVELSSSVTFTVSVKYNSGRDTETTYVFPAVGVS